MEDIHNTVRQLARENRVSEEDLLEALPSSIGNDPVHYSMVGASLFVYVLLRYSYPAVRC